MFDDTIRKHLEPQLNLFKETVQREKIDNSTVKMFIIESLHYMQGNISEVLLINVDDINSMVRKLSAKYSANGWSEGTAFVLKYFVYWYWYRYCKVIFWWIVSFACQFYLKLTVVKLELCGSLLFHHRL